MADERKLGRLAIEFVVVVVGVMVALAGDNMRESLQDSRVKRAYLERIRAEVEAGQADQASQRSRTERARAATLRLIGHLEGSSPTLPGDSLVEVVLLSAAVGFSAGQFGSDVTYRELVGSGQLRLLSDPIMREHVVSYYANLEAVGRQAREVFPLQERVARFTGHLPFALRGGSQRPTTEDRARLRELGQSIEIVPDLREVHSDLTQLLFLLEFLETSAQDLLALVPEVG